MRSHWGWSEVDPDPTTSAQYRIWLDYFCRIGVDTRFMNRLQGLLSGHLDLDELSLGGITVHEGVFHLGNLGLDGFFE